jgi:hypothetical protein
MKSPMVTNLAEIQNKDQYTDLQVLKSPAGWYVGTMHIDPEYGAEPGSRDSGYFATKEEAEYFLRLVEAVPNPQEYTRRYP